MERFHQLSGIVSCCLHGPLPGPELWYPVEMVDVVDYVEHVVGSGRFHNFYFFKRLILNATISSGSENDQRRRLLRMAR